MKGGTVGDYLTYELYQPTTTAPNGPCPSLGAGTVWGTSGANIFTPTASTSKASRTYNVCGQLTSGQDVSADSYSDTVVATVNY
jgi:spore coat protein U-like protein